VVNLDERRLKIWRALSELFLDTEINDVNFDYIAKTVVETGYTREEMHTILWSEVYPVLKNNLRSVAGVWSGWSDDWLLENIRVSSGKPSGIYGLSRLSREIKRCWAEVASRLPVGYA